MGWVADHASALLGKPQPALKLLCQLFFTFRLYSPRRDRYLCSQGTLANKYVSIASLSPYFYYRHDLLTLPLHFFRLVLCAACHCCLPAALCPVSGAPCHGEAWWLLWSLLTRISSLQQEGRGGYKGTAASGLRGKNKTPRGNLPGHPLHP